MSVTTPSKSLAIQAKIICPHCWNDFPPEDTLWIAQHPDLIKEDPRLGENQYLRFSPERFNVKGAAIDPRGFACYDVACPKCHLSIARPLVEIPPFFLSIFGAPQSGKSYFLAAMTWSLRKILPQQFQMTFADADAAANVELQRNENKQFLNMEPDKPVKIEKTQTEEDNLYDLVNFGGQNVRYIKPFLFSLRPLPDHPNSNARQISRVVVLYDNAGEHFLPRTDHATVPVTRHLGFSESLLFLYDPTQDTRFRKAVEGKTNDPQMKVRGDRLKWESPVRQDTILNEANNKVKQQIGLSHNELHKKPLIVIVTKYDTWWTLLGEERLPDPWIENPEGGPDGIHIQSIHDVSQKVKDVLSEYAPEIVSSAESFCDEVIYIPVSATGCSPLFDEQGESVGVAPKDMRPMWVEVPLLYSLARWSEGVVPQIVSRRSDQAPPAYPDPPTFS